MKRFYILLCSVVLVFSLFGCVNNPASDNKNSISATEPKLETTTSSKSVTLEDLESRQDSLAEEFDYISSNNAIEIQGYLGNEKIVVVPQTINGLDVTSIHNYAFGNDCGIEGIKLSDSIIELKESVFVNNESLKTAIIGAGLNNLPEGTFLNCTNLETVKIKDGLKSIGDICFSNCLNLKNLYIPETVDTISKTAFLNVSSDFVIEGKAGSYAENYAREANIPFEAK